MDFIPFKSEPVNGNNGTQARDGHCSSTKKKLHIDDAKQVGWLILFCLGYLPPMCLSVNGMNCNCFCFSQLKLVLI